MPYITSDSQFTDEKRIQITNEIPPYDMSEGVHKLLQNDFWKWFLGFSYITFDLERKNDYSSNYVDPITGESNTEINEDLIPNKITNGVESKTYGDPVTEVWNPETNEYVTVNPKKQVKMELYGTLITEDDLFLHEIYRYLQDMYPDHPDYLELLTPNEIKESFANAAALINYSIDFNFMIKVIDNVEIKNLDERNREIFKLWCRTLLNYAYMRKFFGSRVGMKMFAKSALLKSEVYSVGEYLPIIPMNYNINRENNSKIYDPKYNNIETYPIDHEDRNYKKLTRLIDWDNIQRKEFKESKVLSNKTLFTGLITPQYQNSVVEIISKEDENGNRIETESNLITTSLGEVSKFDIFDNGTDDTIYVLKTNDNIDKYSKNFKVLYKKEEVNTDVKTLSPIETNSNDFVQSLSLTSPQKVNYKKIYNFGDIYSGNLFAWTSEKPADMTDQEFENMPQTVYTDLDINLFSRTGFEERYKSEFNVYLDIIESGLEERIPFDDSLGYTLRVVENTRTIDEANYKYFTISLEKDGKTCIYNRNAESDIDQNEARKKLSSFINTGENLSKMILEEDAYETEVFGQKIDDKEILVQQNPYSIFLNDNFDEREKSIYSRFYNYVFHQMGEDSLIKDFTPNYSPAKEVDVVLNPFFKDSLLLNPKETVKIYRDSIDYKYEIKNVTPFFSNGIITSISSYSSEDKSKEDYNINETEFPLKVGDLFGYNISDSENGGWYQVSGQSKGTIKVSTTYNTAKENFDSYRQGFEDFIKMISLHTISPYEYYEFPNASVSTSPKMFGIVLQNSENKYIYVEGNVSILSYMDLQSETASYKIPSTFEVNILNIPKYLPDEIMKDYYDYHSMEFIDLRDNEDDSIDIYDEKNSGKYFIFDDNESSIKKNIQGIIIDTKNIRVYEFNKSSFIKEGNLDFLDDAYFYDDYTLGEIINFKRDELITNRDKSNIYDSIDYGISFKYYKIENVALSKSEYASCEDYLEKRKNKECFYREDDDENIWSTVNLDGVVKSVYCVEADISFNKFKEIYYCANNTPITIDGKQYIEYTENNKTYKIEYTEDYNIITKPKRTKLGFFCNNNSISEVTLGFVSVLPVIDGDSFKALVNLSERNDPTDTTNRLQSLIRFAKFRIGTEMMLYGYRYIPYINPKLLKYVSEDNVGNNVNIKYAERESQGYQFSCIGQSFKNYLIWDDYNDNAIIKSIKQRVKAEVTVSQDANGKNIILDFKKDTAKRVFELLNSGDTVVGSGLPDGTYILEINNFSVTLSNELNTTGDVELSFYVNFLYEEPLEDGCTDFVSLQIDRDTYDLNNPENNGLFGSDYYPYISNVMFPTIDIKDFIVNNTKIKENNDTFAHIMNYIYKDKSDTYRVLAGAEQSLLIPSTLKNSNQLFFEINLNQIFTYPNRQGNKENLMCVDWLDYLTDNADYYGHPSTIVNVGTNLTLQTDRSGYYTLRPESIYTDNSIKSRFQTYNWTDNTIPMYAQIGTGGDGNRKYMKAAKDIISPNVYGTTFYDDEIQDLVKKSYTLQSEEGDFSKRSTYSSDENASKINESSKDSAGMSIDNFAFEVPIGEYDIQLHKKIGDKYATTLNLSFYKQEFNNMSKNNLGIECTSQNNSYQFFDPDYEPNSDYDSNYLIDGFLYDAPPEFVGCFKSIEECRDKVKSNEYATIIDANNNYSVYYNNTEYSLSFGTVYYNDTYTSLPFFMEQNEQNAVYSQGIIRVGSSINDTIQKIKAELVFNSVNRYYRKSAYSNPEFSGLSELTTEEDSNLKNKIFIVKYIGRISKDDDKDSLSEYAAIVYKSVNEIKVFKLKGSFFTSGISFEEENASNAQFKFFIMSQNKDTDETSQEDENSDYIYYIENTNGSVNIHDMPISDGNYKCYSIFTFLDSAATQKIEFPRGGVLDGSQDISIEVDMNYKSNGYIIEKHKEKVNNKEVEYEVKKEVEFNVSKNPIYYDNSREEFYTYSDYTTTEDKINGSGKIYIIFNEQKYFKNLEFILGELHTVDVVADRSNNTTKQTVLSQIEGVNFNTERLQESDKIVSLEEVYIRPPYSQENESVFFTNSTELNYFIHGVSAGGQSNDTFNVGSDLPISTPEFILGPDLEDNVDYNTSKYLFQKEIDKFVEYNDDGTPNPLYVTKREFKDVGENYDEIISNTNSDTDKKEKTDKQCLISNIQMLSTIDAFEDKSLFRFFKNLMIFKADLDTSNNLILTSKESEFALALQDMSIGDRLIQVVPFDRDASISSPCTEVPIKFESIVGLNPPQYFIDMISFGEWIIGVTDDYNLWYASNNPLSDISNKDLSLEFKAFRNSENENINVLNNLFDDSSNLKVLKLSKDENKVILNCSDSNNTSYFLKYFTVYESENREGKRILDIEFPTDNTDNNNNNNTSNDYYSKDNNLQDYRLEKIRILNKDGQSSTVLMTRDVYSTDFYSGASSFEVKNGQIIEVNNVGIPNTSMVNMLEKDVYLDVNPLFNDDIDAQSIFKNSNGLQSIESFIIQQTPVSKTLYDNIMGSSTEGNIDRVKVDWYHAIAFCNELTKRIMGGLSCSYYRDSNFEHAYSIEDAQDGVYPYWNTMKTGFRLPESKEFEVAFRGIDLTNNSLSFKGYVLDKNQINKFKSEIPNDSSLASDINKNTVFFSDNLGEWCWDSYFDNGQRFPREFVFEDKHGPLKYNKFVFGKFGEIETQTPFNMLLTSQNASLTDFGFRVCLSNVSSLAISQLTLENLKANNAGTTILIDTNGDESKSVVYNDKENTYFLETQVRVAAISADFRYNGKLTDEKYWVKTKLPNVYYNQIESCLTDGANDSKKIASKIFFNADNTDYTHNEYTLEKLSDTTFLGFDNYIGEKCLRISKTGSGKYSMDAATGNNKWSYEDTNYCFKVLVVTDGNIDYINYVEHQEYKSGINDKTKYLIDTDPIEIVQDSSNYNFNYSGIVFRTNQTIDNDEQLQQYLMGTIDSFYARYITGNRDSYYTVFANHKPIGVNQNEQITGITSLNYGRYDYVDMVYINNRNLSRKQYMLNDKVFKLSKFTDEEENLLEYISEKTDTTETDNSSIRRFNIVDGSTTTLKETQAEKNTKITHRPFNVSIDGITGNPICVFEDRCLAIGGYFKTQQNFWSEFDENIGSGSTDSEMEKLYNWWKSDNNHPEISESGTVNFTNFKKFFLNICSNYCEYYERENPSNSDLPSFEVVKGWHDCYQFIKENPTPALFYSNDGETFTVIPLDIIVNNQNYPKGAEKSFVSKLSKTIGSVLCEVSVKTGSSMRSLTAEIPLKYNIYKGYIPDMDNIQENSSLKVAYSTVSCQNTIGDTIGRVGSNRDTNEEFINALSSLQKVAYFYPQKELVIEEGTCVSYIDRESGMLQLNKSIDFETTGGVGLPVIVAMRTSIDIPNQYKYLNSDASVYPTKHLDFFNKIVNYLYETDENNNSKITTTTSYYPRVNFVSEIDTYEKANFVYSPNELCDYANDESLSEYPSFESDSISFNDDINISGYGERLYYKYIEETNTNGDIIGYSSVPLKNISDNYIYLCNLDFSDSLYLRKFKAIPENFKKQFRNKEGDSVIINNATGDIIILYNNSTIKRIVYSDGRIINRDDGEASEKILNEYSLPLNEYGNFDTFSLICFNVALKNFQTPLYYSSSFKDNTANRHFSSIDKVLSDCRIAKYDKSGNGAKNFPYISIVDSNARLAGSINNDDVKILNFQDLIDDKLLFNFTAKDLTAIGNIGESEDSSEFIRAINNATLKEIDSNSVIYDIIEYLDFLKKVEGEEYFRNHIFAIKSIAYKPSNATSQSQVNTITCLVDKLNDIIILNRRLKFVGATFFNYTTSREEVKNRGLDFKKDRIVSNGKTVAYRLRDSSMPVYKIYLSPKGYGGYLGRGDYFDENFKVAKGNEPWNIDKTAFEFEDGEEIPLINSLGLPIKLCDENGKYLVDSNGNPLKMVAPKYLNLRNLLENEEQFIKIEGKVFDRTKVIDKTIDETTDEEISTERIVFTERDKFKSEEIKTIEREPSLLPIMEIDKKYIVMNGGFDDSRVSKYVLARILTNAKINRSDKHTNNKDYYTGINVNDIDIFPPDRVYFNPDGLPKPFVSVKVIDDDKEVDVVFRKDNKEFFYSTQNYTNDYGNKDLLYECDEEGRYIQYIVTKSKENNGDEKSEESGNEETYYLKSQVLDFENPDNNKVSGDLLHLNKDGSQKDGEASKRKYCPCKPIYNSCEDWFMNEFYIEGKERNPLSQVIRLNTYYDVNSKSIKENIDTYTYEKSSRDMILKSTANTSRKIFDIRPSSSFSEDLETNSIINNRNEKFFDTEKGIMKFVIYIDENFQKNKLDELPDGGKYSDILYGISFSKSKNDFNSLIGNAKYSYIVNSAEDVIDKSNKDKAIIQISELALLDKNRNVVAYATFPPIEYRTDTQHISFTCLINDEYCI